MAHSVRGATSPRSEAVQTAAPRLDRSCWADDACGGSGGLGDVGRDGLTAVPQWTGSFDEYRFREKLSC
jgi:hypothetical protein